MDTGTLTRILAHEPRKDGSLWLSRRILGTYPLKITIPQGAQYLVPHLYLAMYHSLTQPIILNLILCDE